MREIPVAKIFVTRHFLCLSIYSFSILYFFFYWLLHWSDVLLERMCGKGKVLYIHIGKLK